MTGLCIGDLSGVNLPRLCIGGPYDGVSMVLEPSMRSLVVEVDGKRTEYRVEILAAPTQDFKLLVHETMSLAQALRALIEWYHPPESVK